MAYATTDLTLGAEAAPARSIFAAPLTAARTAVTTYIQKRRVYIRTLTELQAYSRRDLLDLGIDPDALKDFSRRAAGL